MFCARHLNSWVTLNEWQKEGYNKNLFDCIVNNRSNFVHVKTKFATLPIKYFILFHLLSTVRAGAYRF